MSQIEPGDREEMLLRGILNGDTTTNIEPGSRKEALLKAILENGGGGGGGDVTEIEKATIDPVVGINIYDEEHNSVADGEQYRVGTVYLDGYTGNLVLSTAGQRASYFSELHVYNASGDDMGVSLGSTVNTLPLGTRQGKLIAIPDGAVYFTFKYRTTSSSGTLVSQVMVTKGNTLGNFYSPYELLPQMVRTIREVSAEAAYVSPTGNDANDGLTHDTAVATFGRALEISNVVYADRGVYNQALYITGRHGVRILPYDDGETYSASTPRQPIELNGGDTFLKSELTYDEGTYDISYSGGFQFNEVFKTHTKPYVVPNTTNVYNANVFVHLTSEGKLKLKPVESLEACEGESDTFFWDNTTNTLYINVSTDDFVSITVLKQIIGVVITDSDDVVLEDVCARYTNSSLVKIERSSNIVFNNCEASFSATAMGFEISSSNVIFNHCYARENATDGFNFHGYGVTQLNDCTGEWNYDDGCSHHNQCFGTVNGGVYSGNGKGGVVPAYGANVNVYNVVAKNNKYGIAFLWQSGDPDMKGVASGCVMVGNEKGLVVQSGWTVDAIGLKYSDNTTDKDVTGTLNEY